jgi:hypothetical protein
MISRKDHNLAIATIPARALYYRCAAQRDERNGFPHTAAMKWRYAAELYSPNTEASEYCWEQWERIMHLPRRLAGPVSGVCNEASDLSDLTGSLQH